MKIRGEKQYEMCDARLEALIQKGTALGGMDNLCAEDMAEYKTLSNAVYEWECREEPRAWRVSPTLVAEIKSALRRKGYKQKDAAPLIGLSPTMFSDLLHGRRPLSFDVARSIHHMLGIPSDLILA
ncbi:MAG: helix-turn-helix domain-containing protein [Bacteroidaceae bacterium]|nr:helix-turn-helix domain-containing protein [Bacteroidaceae bacterium]